MEQFEHISVLLDECIDGLDIKPDGIYVDGTTGGGGHSSHILSHLNENGRLICIDKDDVALEYLKQKFNDSRVTIVKSDFKDMHNVIKDLEIDGVDGILLDLGVSSVQIDTPERGFSYRFDATLDMRMDNQNDLTAYKVVNEYDYASLVKILFEYGEESFAKQIVRQIIKQREIAPITTTLQLVDIIESVIPKKFQTKGSVCKKTFQAIRIEVNGELDSLDVAVNNMIGILNPNGRIAIITFHSLEDRVVKNTFKQATLNCICDKSLPVCVCHNKAKGELVNRKPILASQHELDINKRSSSAKLRVFKKY